MKKFLKSKVPFIPAILIMLVLTGPAITTAINTVSDGFKLQNSYQIINAHSECRDAVSIDGQEYFIPTNSSVEWAGLRDQNKKPDGVQLLHCSERPCTASSGSYAGAYVGGNSSIARTTTGVWIDDSEQCLKPWLDYVFSAHYNDNERSGPPLNRTINVCSWFPSLATGEEFFITTDVIGGSWVINPGTSSTGSFTVAQREVKALGTAVFKKGTAANSNIINGTPQSSSNKSHQSNRNYDGNCTVTIQSFQGSGDRTDYHDRALAVYNIGTYIAQVGSANWGGRLTGEIDYCQTGTCVGTDPNSYTWVNIGYGACSAFCGGGTQTQEYQCQNPSGDPAWPCLGNKPTGSTQSCNTATCGTGTGSWSAGGSLNPAAAQCSGNVAPSGACSPMGTQCNVNASFKGGAYQVPYECTNVPAVWNQNGNTVTATQCSGNVAPSGACSPIGSDCHTAFSIKGGPPLYTRHQCGAGAPPVTYSWQTGSWSTCSATCGGGTQSRTVVCKSSTNATVSDSNCVTTKPGTSQSCNSQSCSQTNGQCGPADGGTYSSFPPVSQRCSVGASSGFSYEPGFGWDWSCLGTGGGNNDFCFAYDTGGLCFVPGVQVSMADGSFKNIEDVKIGDSLLARNNQRNTVQKRIVLEHTGLVYAFNGDGNFFVTEDHPFLTPEGWKSLNPVQTMKDTKEDLQVTLLEIGDILITDEGEVVLEKLDSEEYTGYVYNFTVDGTHEYIADGYMVHNLKD